MRNSVVDNVLNPVVAALHRPIIACHTRVDDEHWICGPDTMSSNVAMWPLLEKSPFSLPCSAAGVRYSSMIQRSLVTTILLFLHFVQAEGPSLPSIRVVPCNR